MIVRTTYNPGHNPFAPQPRVRFDGSRKLGDAGVTYEFNVKIQRIESDATQVQWDSEVERSFEGFTEYVRGRWPWLGAVYFTGRSGGWLAIEDPSGRMTGRTLVAIQKQVGLSLQAFKRHMVAEYPRGVSP